MHARVTKYRMRPDRVDEDIRQGHELQPQIEAMPGCLGIYYLVNREAGETLGITLWQDEHAMRESEVRASQVREQSARQAAAEIVTIERFEVVMQPSRLTLAAGR